MARAVARSWCGKSIQRDLRLQFDAAGTHVQRGGVAIDPRARAALSKRGYEVGRERSRQVTTADIEKADAVLAMDAHSLAALRRLCPAGHSDKLSLLLDAVPGRQGQEVPDPYFGPPQGFDRVLDLCELAVREILSRWGVKPAETPPIRE
jgi:protein-tyrosine phosphatase